MQKQKKKKGIAFTMESLSNTNNNNNNKRFLKKVFLQNLKKAPVFFVSAKTLLGEFDCTKSNYFHFTLPSFDF